MIININKRYKLVKFALLFYLFFMICLGLGYPTLNRYDPSRTGGTIDSKQYFNMVKNGIQSAEGHWRYRVLIPYAAKPISWLVKDRIGTWNYLSFSLLFINSLFCAASALMIIFIGVEIVGDFSVSLTGSLLYLLSSQVSNGQLAGLVDSGETFFLLALMLALINKRWYYLPIIAIFGAITKESIVPISLSLTITYLYFDNKNEQLNKSAILSLIIMIIMGILSVTIIRTIIIGSIIWPWDIISQEKGSVNILSAFLLNICHTSFWYNYLWLMPFGLVMLNYFPKKILYAYGIAAFSTLLLGAWNTSGAANISRILFNVIGPLLSLSVALLLHHWFREKWHKTMITSYSK
jgi:hypothetical protein